MERELGSGASGRVVAAIRDADRQRVAIKYLSPRLLGDPQFVASFRAEAALLKTLDVPYIVRLLEYVEAPGQGAAIIMELVDGVSLREMIMRQGPAGPEAALAVLKGSLLGLAAAHALGIVHRDYKPDNVLVDRSGQSKLADFGVAVRAGQDAPAAGTPLYMAPEQWDGGPATPATDIYAATAVFFECLTGTAPFSGPPGQLAAQHATAEVPVGLVDEPLRELISRGMAKEPAARPGDAAQFLAELQATAEAAYGADWESVGRGHLAGRAAALLLLLLQHGSAATAGGTGTATTSTSLPGSTQATQSPLHPIHAGSQHAGQVQHAEHLRHLEHLGREHAEHLEHVQHLEHAGGAGQSGQPGASAAQESGRSARRVSRPRPRLHLAVAGGAAVVVVAAVAGVAVALSGHHGSGSSGGSPSSVSHATTGGAATPAPGDYPVNRQIQTQQSYPPWVATLTDIRVLPSGQAEFFIVYDNTNPAPDIENLSCLGNTDPSVNTVALSNGQTVAATADYCSQHPYDASIDINPGQTWTSYVIFPDAAQLTTPFDFSWDAEGLAGTLADLQLPA
jgi:hypothetical protein